MRNIILFATSLILVGIIGTAAFCSEPENQTASSGTDSVESGYRNLDELFNLYQPYLDNIGAYKPTYFLLGVEPEDSKFQISLKYRLFNSDTPILEKFPLIEGLHLGYTQTSFWDLEADSQPFDDTSYKPELFFLSPNLFSGHGFSHVFLQTGFQHESNGRAGDESRSTNFLYAEPIFIFFHKRTEIGFQISPRIWMYVNNDDNTNGDLYKYRGYFDLGVKVGKADGIVLESHWRWADEGHSLIFDLTYPLDRVVKTGLQLYLHAQYVDALAEDLLDYRNRNRALRLGISIVR